MITTAEYLREKARAEAAEAKVLELEAEIKRLSCDVVTSEPESEDAPE